MWTCFVAPENRYGADPSDRAVSGDKRALRRFGSIGGPPPDFTLIASRQDP
jgi:hypothetical protein